MPRKIHIADVTLRDGEQSMPGTLTKDEKVEIAKQLVLLNVDIIEAGNPISSNEDFEAVKAVAEAVKGVMVSGLARCVPGDIKRAWEAVKNAEHPMIHVYLGISEIHMRGQLRKSNEQIIEMAVENVELAESMCTDIQFSPMDAARAHAMEGSAFLCKVIEAVINAGATIVNIPDTTGYGVPVQFAELIREILDNVQNIEKARLAVHCHDDLGMATANSLEAVKAGAAQIECCIGGMGERAGNTATEQVVMGLRKREEYYEAHTDIVTELLYPTAELISRITGIALPFYGPIVGSNAFSHSSGVHQDGMDKDDKTYEIVKPAEVGREKSTFVLTARSGRAGLNSRLRELGYKFSVEQIDRIYDRFIIVAEKKGEVADSDLHLIVVDEVPSVPEVYKLEYVQTLSGTKRPMAAVGLWKEDELIEETALGDGPINAACTAVDEITGIKVELIDCSTTPATTGADAMADAIVRITDNGRIIIGRGSSTDTTEASIKAYVNAINRLLDDKEE